MCQQSESCPPRHTKCGFESPLFDAVHRELVRMCVWRYPRAIAELFSTYPNSACNSQGLPRFVAYHRRGHNVARTKQQPNNNSNTNNSNSSNDDSRQFYTTPLLVSVSFPPQPAKGYTTIYSLRSFPTVVYPPVPIPLLYNTLELSPLGHDPFAESTAPSTANISYILQYFRRVDPEIQLCILSAVHRGYFFSSLRH